MTSPRVCANSGRASSTVGRVSISGGRAASTSPTTVWSPALLGEDVLFNFSESPYSRITNGTSRYVDGSRGGTARQLQPGRCYHFNDVDDQIRTASALSTGDSSITACAWIYSEDTSNVETQVIAGEFTSQSDQRRWLFWHNQDDLYVHLYGPTGGSTSDPRKQYIATAVLTQDTWHHVAFTYDSGTDELIFYVDGADASATASGDDDTLNGLFATTEELSIGHYHNVGGSPIDHFDGYIFDFRLYGRALTATEISCIASMSPTSTDIGPTDAKVWYKGDEGGTTTAAINSGSLGSTADGTITSSAVATFHDVAANDQFSFQNEVGFRQVAEFDGSSDEVDIAGTSLSDTLSSSNDWTVSTWFHADDVGAGGKPLFASRKTSTNKMTIIINTSVISAGYYDGSFSHKSTAFTDTTGWHHVAVVNDGGTVSAYLDGAAMAGTTAYGTSSANGVTIGYGSGGDYFNGRLSDLRVYSVAKSSAEVSAIYTGTNDTTSLVSQYFNTNTNRDLVVCDEVGSNHGTITATAAAFWDSSIPRDESDSTKDRLGLTLPFTGKAPRDAVLSTPCCTFNGTSDYITPPVDGVTAAGSSHTIACWVYRDTAGTTDYYYEIDSTRMQLYLHTDNLFHAYDLTNDVTSTNTVSANAWHRLVAVFSTGNVKLYVDGVEEADATFDTMDFTGATQHRIGSRYGTTANAWGGRLVDFQFHHGTAWTAAQVKSDYEGSSPSGADIHIPMTEGAGGIAHDVSGGQSHGTITGTESAIWANTQNVYDTLVQDGYCLGTRYVRTSTESQASGSRLTVGTMDKFSIACWVRGDGIVASEDQTGQRAWLFWVDTTTQKLNVQFGGTNVVTSTDAIDTTVWTHIAFTFDGGTTTSQLYVNGVAVSQTVNSFPTKINNKAAAFRIGAYGFGGVEFNGMLNDLVIEQEEWDSTTVNEIRSGTAYPSDAWRFPDGDGVNHNTVSKFTSTVYDGTNDWYSKGSRLTSGSVSALTVAAWVRSAVSADQAVASEFNPTTNESWWFGMDATGVAKIQVSQDGSANETKLGNTQIDNGVWHYIAVVIDGTSVILYVDGVADKTSTFTFSGLYDSTASFEIGRIDAASEWTGDISRLAVEQAAWSAATVRAAGRGTIPSTAWYWPAGDGTETQQGLADLTLSGNVNSYCTPRPKVMSTWYDGTSDWYDKGSRLTTGSATSLSFAAWILLRSAGTGTTRLIASEDDGTSLWRFYISSEKIRLRVSDDGSNWKDYSSSPAIPADTWTHVVFVFNANTIAFYINGALVSNVVNAERTVNALHDAAVAFELGAYANGTFPMDGGMGAVAIEQAAWSATTVKRIFEGYVPPTAWYFPKGDGTEAEQEITALTEQGKPTFNGSHFAPITATNGTPDKIVVPDGIITSSPHYGPGVLPPYSSLDLSGGEAEAPVSELLDGLISDLTYDQGDGSEDHALFVNSNPKRDTPIIATGAALSGQDLENMEDYLGP